MDNNTSNQQEDRVMKILAIVGFIVAVLILAWLAIQVIRFIPGAFSSLASLADRINNGDESELEVTISDSVVNTGTPVTIRFTDLEEDGTYRFEYACVSGVSLDLRINGEIVAISCEEEYEIPTGLFAIEALFASARERYADVQFAIIFTPERGDSERTEREFTIVNASIPLASNTDVTPNEDDEEDDETPAPLPYTGYDPEEVSSNRYTELVIAYENVGVLKNGSFSPKQVLDSDDTGAFQFMVTNTGTEASSAWTFDATLMSGTGYTSDAQKALAPNESVIVTVAFDNLGNGGVQTFGATLKGGNDANDSNNSFSRSVAVSN